MRGDIAWSIVWEGYEAAIRTGGKRQTIRVDVAPGQTPA
jgi:hypothetical protein